MKLNSIISILLSAIISITLLTGCEKTESVAEETTVSETTVATAPTDLTEEEMAIWESMPDIVTMRVYNDYATETTEILYIEKSGAMKSFVSDEYYEGYKDSEWIANKIKTSQASVIDEVDIHKLIELYKILLNIDNESKFVKLNELFVSLENIEITYGYELFGVKNGEILLISSGQTLTEYIRKDSYSKDLFFTYLNFDKFISIMI